MTRSAPGRTAGRLIRRTATLACALALTAAWTAPSAQSATFEPCFDLLGPGFSCLRLEVPLDRTAAVAGTTRIQAIKIDATEGPRKGTLAILTGGPGQSVTPFLAEFYGLFDGANRYDILLVDQRGTGLSENLRCEGFERAEGISPGDKFDRLAGICAETIGPARAAYDTREAVDDLEAVRETLGIDKMALFGISYGTKLALAYAGTYPSRVQSMLLDSVLPISGPTAFSPDMAPAIRRAAQVVCARSAQCRKLLKDPVGAIRATANAIRKTPLRGTAIDREGSPKPRKLTAYGLLELIGAADLNAFIWEQLPGALYNLNRGDPEPLLRLAPPDSSVAEDRRVAQARGTETMMFNPALNIATVCEDAVNPWPRGTALGTRQPYIDAASAALPTTALDPFDRAEITMFSVAAYCRGWPEGPTAPVLPAATQLPNVPTLALNGELDTRTPTDSARAALAANPNVEFIELPNSGHSVVTADPSGCAMSLAKRFLIFGATNGRCVVKPKPVPVRPAPPVALAEVKPLKGTCSRAPGRKKGKPRHSGDKQVNARRKKRRAAARRRDCRIARRVGGATYLSIRDVIEQAVAGSDLQGGGLRGGTWEAIPSEDGGIGGLSLAGMEYLPGLLVTGALFTDEFPRVSGHFEVLRVGGGSGFFDLDGKVTYSRRDQLDLSGKFNGQIVEMTIRVQRKLAKPATTLGQSGNKARSLGKAVRKSRPQLGWLIRSGSGWKASRRDMSQSLRLAPGWYE